MLGSVGDDDGDVNENGKKGPRYVHHACLHISLPSLHDYDVEMSNFMFCKGRENKRTTTLFPLNFDSLLELNSRKNFPQKGFERDGISVIKFEAARNHFLGDVFVFLAVVVA